MLVTFDLIQDVTEKSKQLLALAKESNWDEFSKLNTERQSILLNFDFENMNLSERDSDRLYAKMSELVILNDELESICVTQHGEIASELQNITQGAKAVQAYSA